MTPGELKKAIKDIGSDCGIPGEVVIRVANGPDGARYETYELVPSKGSEVFASKLEEDEEAGRVSKFISEVQQFICDIYGELPGNPEDLGVSIEITQHDKEDTSE